MLKWKIDVLSELKKKGYNTTIIRKENLLSQSTLTNFNNDVCVFSSINLNKICNLLECQPGDLIEYVPDED